MKLTDTAVTFLRYLIRPGEQLKYIVNAFVVRGMNFVPTLVLITTVNLKLISFVELLPTATLLRCPISKMVLQWLLPLVVEASKNKTSNSSRT